MSFTDLTWEDLKTWAGDRAVRRAKSYVREVMDLRRTADGGLLAWVIGGDQYATRVSMSEKGKLSSTCTCPVGSGCKHAVAVVLALLDAEKRKQPPPMAEEGDERLAVIAGIDDDKAMVASEYAREAEERPADGDLRAHLSSLSKDRLVDLLMEGRNVLPELGRQLADAKALESGRIDRLIAGIRAEINAVANEPSRQGWRGQSSHFPDYSGVKKRLESLLAAGQADAVVRLGDYLMQRGIEQINQSHDEGECAMAVADCLEPVLKAARQSSMTPAQRLLWQIDLSMMDGYGILDGCGSPIAQEGDADAWSGVAAELASRLDQLPRPSPAGRDQYATRYERERIMRWLLRALDHAGRSEEVIEVLQRETAHTQCYAELVGRLLKCNRKDEARQWALRGIEATRGELPGLAAELEATLRELAAEENNPLLVAAYRAEEFFRQPEIVNYEELKQAATAAGVWDAVRAAALRFLETGIRPGQPAPVPPVKRVRGRPAKPPLPVEAETDPWPLPEPEVRATAPGGARRSGPDFQSLVSIALHEGRHDDALTWYCRGVEADAYAMKYQGPEVARAVAATHPAEAIGIWHKLVSKQLVFANQGGYHIAGGYLEEMKMAYDRMGRLEEWSAYLGQLRQDNHRRPRMLKVLDALEGRRRRILE